MLKTDVQFSICAKYIPSLKNVQVKEFYEKCGFTCVSESKDGTKNYEIKLADADLKIEKYYHIKLK